MTTRLQRARHGLPVLACVIAAHASHVSAQQPPATPAAPPAPRANIPTLRSEPYEVPNLGMSIHLPEDSLIDLSRIEGGRTTIVITPQDGSGTYVFQIHQSVSADHALELREALDAIIQQRRAFHTGQDARGRKVSTVRPFDRVDDLMLSQHPAQRVYLDVPPDPSVNVTGYTMFHTGPGQFVIIQMDAPVALFPRVRALYELMVESVRFKDPATLGAERTAALLAGKALLAQFNHDDRLGALDNEPRFYRIHRPASSDADSEQTEVGFQRVHLFKGSVGDLDPKKPIETWKDADRQPGYLARVEARAIVGESIIDTVSAFFLSEDLRGELWTITMNVREKNASQTWTETGIRRDDRLTIKTSRTGLEPTTADWSPLPEGYISRVETYLLPRLVAMKKIPGDFGFYTYDSSLSKITLRRESFLAKPADARAAWIQTTTPSENSGDATSELDARGVLIRRTTPDGQVTEPIEQERLQRLWRERKLPTQ